MQGFKVFGVVLLGLVTTSARGQAQDTVSIVSGGCTIQTRAYINKSYNPKESSRWDLRILRTPKDFYQWDYTLDDHPNYHYTNLSGGTSLLPYTSTQKQTTIRATFHQYAILEEKVIFKNLDLGPSSGIFGSGSETPKHNSSITPRYLTLKEPVTVTTPSGISITLPAQGAEVISQVFSRFNGNPNALFIRINTSPDQPLVSLPESPLFKKHRKPLSIKLECAAPNFMVYYRADNTYKTIAVDLPDLATVMHLDTLTVLVRQRVDLQSIPLAIHVPISRDVNE